ncbi:MAG: endo alpha-1,4 polygalactosaminidase [Anaerolineales bacterium]|nr:endo alpha-1,4 polygalactosaminidase [Anaerolineales bacterium]
MRKKHINSLFGLLALILAACGAAPAATVAPTSAPAPTATRTLAPPSPAPSFTATPAALLELPPEGSLYHGVFPGGITGEEDDLTPSDLRSYEQSVGKKAAWVYFSHNWYRGREFPTETASWIREAGSVPYIRLMLRSDAEQDHAEPFFTLDRIISGDFDADFHAWAGKARDFGSPLIAEFGTEMNGEWFSWNGVWNGGGTLDGYGEPGEYDGPERFRDAYRHIIAIARDEGADNILWVFHVNNDDWPDEDWNRFENYYPGDEWIDWLGVSIYGAQTPFDDEWPIFRDAMDTVYPRLVALSPDKPIVLAEFAVAANNPLGDQAEWAQAALTDLTSRRWSSLIGFSWWNEYWQNDDNPKHDTTMRVQDNPALGAVFQQRVGANRHVLGRFNNLPRPPESPTTAPASGWWRPAVGTTWQWQLDFPPIDQSFDVDMYDIDLFDNEASVVADLHAAGRKVICYINVGSWEDWRPDRGLFPAAVLGNDYEGWEGERWLDIRQIDLLAPIMRARFDQCKAKGFDGIEADNMDGYTNGTGFPLTYEDQLAYNIWLADEAHRRGLSIGLKNDADQAVDLLPYFDWAMVEDCFAEGWCEQMSPFIEAGKPVFAAEYTDTGIRVERFCPEAEALKFSVILKTRELNGYRKACP